MPLVPTTATNPPTVAGARALQASTGAHQAGARLPTARLVASNDLLEEEWERVTNSVTRAFRVMIAAVQHAFPFCMPSMDC